MLSSTNPASPSLNQNRNAKDEISAGPKQDLLPQTTTHILTIRALQNTNKADLLGHKHRGINTGGINTKTNSLLTHLLDGQGRHV